MEKMNIKTDRDYLTTLLENVKDGKIVIPKFQRDFVWSTKQIVDLFDSIMKGFPIGSIILWIPENEAFSIIEDIKGIKINTDLLNTAYYVLDGRQRITALMGVLYEQGELSKDFYVNLDDFKIVCKPQLKKEKYNMLCLSEAFDAYALVGYIERLKSFPISENEKKRYADQAKRVNRTLVSYEIGHITVRGGHIDDAVEIFSRLNSKATEISTDYMIQALAYNPKNDFLFSECISDIKSRIAVFNFESLKRDLILKCVFNYTEKVFFDGKAEDILALSEDLPNIMENVSEDIFKTIEFLYNMCGVIDTKLLPYTYQLIMLAVFFKENKHPSQIQLHELSKWFFYTTYTNYFTNTSLTNIRKDVVSFNRFAKRETTIPMEYNEKIEIQPVPELWTLNSVRACGFILMSIIHMKGNENRNTTLDLYVLPNTGNRMMWNTICFVTKDECLDFIEALKYKDPWNEKFAKYNLTENLWDLYIKQDLTAFRKEREKLLAEKEIEILQNIIPDVDIVFTNI